MKMTITERDVSDLVGKFIIQLDTLQPDKSLTNENWSFMSEKRLRLITYNQNNKLCLQGLYYSSREFDNLEEFIEYFNKVNDGKRFHRLLTSRELNFVFEKFKENNY